MSILVISDCFKTPDQTELSRLTAYLRALINRARRNHRAIVFLQPKASLGFDQIGVNIGRFEPIFQIRPCQAWLPEGLTDFLVSRRERKLHLSGIAPQARFEDMSAMFERGGFSLEADDRSRLCVHEEPQRLVQMCSAELQLSAYETGPCNIFDCSASIKNQSTRCPRV